MLQAKLLTWSRDSSPLIGRLLLGEGLHSAVTSGTSQSRLPYSGVSMSGAEGSSIVPRSAAEAVAEEWTRAALFPVPAAALSRSRRLHEAENSIGSCACPRRSNAARNEPCSGAPPWPRICTCSEGKRGRAFGTAPRGMGPPLKAPLACSAGVREMHAQLSKSKQALGMGARDDPIQRFVRASLTVLWGLRRRSSRGGMEPMNGCQYLGEGGGRTTERRRQEFPHCERRAWRKGPPGLSDEQKAIKVPPASHVLASAGAVKIRSFRPPVSAAEPQLLPPPGWVVETTRSISARLGRRFIAACAAATMPGSISKDGRNTCRHSGRRYCMECSWE